MRRILCSLLFLLFVSELEASQVDIRLPERFRVLVDQRFDLRIEAREIAGEATLALRVDGGEAPGWPAPEITRDEDADPDDADQAWTFRNVSLPQAGVTDIEAVVTDDGGSTRQVARIGVQDFDPAGAGRSVILYIGDAMGTVYRDAARIVAGSTDGGFREGFFDELLEMDRMPVSGMVMTHAMDRLVPDSANTASAWSTGNKTVAAGLAALPDNTDWRFTARDPETRRYALDNPRVETLWQYLRRRYGYRTGIVTTSDVTDATPAAAGAHTIARALGDDIARQFVDGGFSSGPVFDVILGGGKNRFTARDAAGAGDSRDLAAELVAAGYTYVETREALNRVAGADPAPGRLLGLFRTGHMNVAYDKLGLARPPGEPQPDFGGFEDQPFLDEMTRAALATLARDDRPFVLLVEGASVDKQSHPNYAAGTIWDAVELDRAVGVGRRFAAGRRGGPGEPLVVVTADHDQSMQILGVADTSVEGAVENVRGAEPFPPPGGFGGGVGGFPDYRTGAQGYPANDNRLRIAVGFRTGGHTGSSVPITAEGPGALLFTGYFDQTDVFFKIARAISADTSALDRLLEEKTRLDAIGPDY